MAGAVRDLAAMLAATIVIVLALSGIAVAELGYAKKAIAALREKGVV